MELLDSSSESEDKKCLIKKLNLYLLLQDEEYPEIVKDFEVAFYDVSSKQN